MIKQKKPFDVLKGFIRFEKILTYRRRPVNNLYKIRITAITIRMWIMLPKSGNAK
tara:strand:- start:2102 stop:2266 length:165 start_codon:yes stop_codon:yes gene_type:complete